MLTDNYYRRLVAICAGLLVAIIVLAVTLYGSGPRARLVSFSDDPTTSAFTRYTTMNIVFDRSIEQRDYTRLVSVQPSLRFTTQTNAQSITITFDESLKHGSDYVVSIAPGIRDRQGKTTEDLYSYEFTTAQASYAYIERNYQPDGTDDGADDHVMLAHIGGRPESIFSSQEIRSFAANRDHMVIAVKGPDKDSLYTLDLQSGDLRLEALALEGRIDNLVISPRGPTALFTIRPDSANVPDDEYADNVRRVESLNTNTGETISLVDKEGNYVQAYDIAYDSYGQAVVVQDESQTYYGVSPYNDYPPSIIGTYTGTYGFDATRQEVIFRDRADVVRYEIATGDTALTNLGYVQMLSADKGSIFALSTAYSRGIPNSTLNMYEDWSSEASTAWTSSAGSLESVSGFNQSYDDQLVALQLDPSTCDYDAIGSNSQCKNVTTLIYDVADKQEIARVSGFDLVWLP